MGFYTNIRYGKMSLVSLFRSDEEKFAVHDQCVVKSERGTEIGVILKPLAPVPENISPDGLGRILRKATPDDVVRAKKLRESEEQELKFCRDSIVQHKLPMKLTAIDHLFGGDKIIFYFTAESRVDFRGLVKDLAREFKTRIELKQIGSRDEAKLCGTVGHCGLELCCRGFLKELGGITMDMAKIQKHTADPSKITGMCGKLLCCLRYEYGAYLEARKGDSGVQAAAKQEENPVNGTTRRVEGTENNPQDQRPAP